MEESGKWAAVETFCPPNPSSLKAEGLWAEPPCSRRAGDRVKLTPVFQPLLHRLLLQVPTLSRGFCTSVWFLCPEGGKAPCSSLALGSPFSCERSRTHVDIRSSVLAFLLLIYIFASSVLDCWSVLGVGRKFVRIRDKHLAAVLGWLWNHGFFTAGKVKIEPSSSLVCRETSFSS